jgi:hypothetical protein
MPSQSFDTTTVILARGHKFTITLRHLPVEDIVCRVEASIAHLPSSTAEEIRYKMACILKRACSPKSNLTRKDRATLRELQENKFIYMVLADKGNATVILDSSDYCD